MNIPELSSGPSNTASKTSYEPVLSRLPSLAIFSDPSLDMNELCSAVVDHGVTRSNKIIPLEHAQLWLHTQVTPDIIILNYQDEVMPQAQNFLIALNQLSVQKNVHLIIGTSLESIDYVDAHIDAPLTTILCAPKPSDYFQSLLLCQAQMQSHLHESVPSFQTMQLIHLAGEMDRVVKAITSFKEETSRFAHNNTAYQSSIHAPDQNIQGGVLTAKLVRRLIKQRQQRQKFFEADLFADPAWDMMLDLLAAHLEQKMVSTSSLCLASGVPVTTALRWIKKLTDSGQFIRVLDENDGRRAYIQLSEETIEKMKHCLMTMQSS